MQTVRSALPGSATPRAWPATAVAALGGLPEGAVTSLCEAFVEEVADRLPRLRRAASGPSYDGLPEEVARDAHTLASSACVVGEPEAARLARAAEDLLRADGDLTGLADLVDGLERELAPWTRP